MISLVVVAQLALAAPVTNAQLAEAKRLYQQGRSDYDAGRFDLAIHEFLAADRIKPAAALAYNVAQAYQKLANNDKAVVYLRLYLERAPAAPDRGAVEATIKNLLAQAPNSVVVVTTAGPAGEAPPGKAPEQTSPAPAGAIEKSPEESAPHHSHAVGIALTVTGVVAASAARCRTAPTAAAGPTSRGTGATRRTGARWASCAR
jgi:tetratricopeptide (TPR) repeat protein